MSISNKMSAIDYNDMVRFRKEMEKAIKNIKRAARIYNASSILKSRTNARHIMQAGHEYIAGVWTPAMSLRRTEDALLAAQHRAAMVKMEWGGDATRFEITELDDGLIECKEAPAIRPKF